MPGQTSEPQRPEAFCERTPGKLASLATAALGSPFPSVFGGGRPYRCAVHVPS